MTPQVQQQSTKVGDPVWVLSIARCARVDAIEQLITSDGMVHGAYLVLAYGYGFRGPCMLDNAIALDRAPIGCPGWMMLVPPLQRPVGTA